MSNTLMQLRVTATRNEVVVEACEPGSPNKGFFGKLSLGICPADNADILPEGCGARVMTQLVGVRDGERGDRKVSVPLQILAGVLVGVDGEEVKRIDGQPVRVVRVVFFIDQGGQRSYPLVFADRGEQRAKAAGSARNRWACKPNGKGKRGAKAERPKSPAQTPDQRREPKVELPRKPVAPKSDAIVVEASGVSGTPTTMQRALAAAGLATISSANGSPAES